MKLTGECKEDFIKWLLTCEKYGYDNFNIDCIENNMLRIGDYYLCKLPTCFTEALIIKWFDSVGIYVTVNYNFIQAKFTNSVKDKDTILYRGRLYSTRQEATEKAIIKANEIYNETKA